MRKRFVLLASFVVSCFIPILSIASGGGTTNPCWNIGMWYWPDTMPPGCIVVGPGQGLLSYLIACPKAGCPPEPCNCAHEAGKPISLSTGDSYIKQSDLSIPGLGGGLDLTRTWDSFFPQGSVGYSTGFFGQSWRSTYEENIRIGSDHYIKYTRGDGKVWSFAYENGQCILAAPKNTQATLSQDGVSWTLTFQNGEQRKFSFITGFLNTITDRNGNTTQLSYDSSNRLTTVTSPGGQHLYFNYGSGSTSNLITSVTTDFGMSLSYSYDTQGRLTQVTRPDQTTVSFTYNDQSQITSVTDNNGKVLESHTYDSTGRGLTSSLANGVNSVSITYPQ